jgi:hypothetical protein
MSSAPTWKDATDAQLRAAAAGVMGWTEYDDTGEWHYGIWLDEKDVEQISQADWTPDTNRDQLARVFVAALEKPNIRSRSVYWDWDTALTDPRAALAALLDLLLVPIPHE